MRRACRPTTDVPMSPSISDFGTRAATESTTMMSIAALCTSASTISSACSPVSGCEMRSSSMLTPSLRAYSGSRACSASMNAAMPPAFCASAIMCSVTVVLPEDSGPNTSMMRPRGMPPTPSAISSGKIPVEITSTFMFALASPRRMIAPLPCAFSMFCRAFSSASSRVIGLSSLLARLSFSAICISLFVSVKEFSPSII